MPAATHVAVPPVPPHVPTYDAIVIGAGISGMFMLYESVKNPGAHRTKLHRFQDGKVFQTLMAGTEERYVVG